MAILAPFRAPQPKAYYPGPGNSPSGVQIGNALPRNLSAISYVFRGLAAGLFGGGVVPTPGGSTGAIPCLWGMSRGVIGIWIPPVPIP